MYFHLQGFHSTRKNNESALSDTVYILKNTFHTYYHPLIRKHSSSLFPRNLFQFTHEKIIHNYSVGLAVPSVVLQTPINLRVNACACQPKEESTCRNFYVTNLIHKLRLIEKTALKHFTVVFFLNKKKLWPQSHSM